MIHLINSTNNGKGFKVKDQIKTFNMRMPRDIWIFLKRTAADQEISMTDIIVRCVEKYKKRLENKLTDDDTSV
jgi:hypothetical protein